MTGAAGSIGTVLTSGLIDRGHDVVGLDRVAAPDGFAGAWHTVDSADADAVEAVFVTETRAGGVDAVFHLACMPIEGSLPDEL